MIPTRASLILVAVAALLAAGCTKVSVQGGGPANGNPWTHHGVLRMAEIAEPDNLNPFVGNQQIEVDLSMFWAGYLFRWNDRNEFVPELATVVPSLANGDISKDGRTITYHLRRGVRWDDGAPFSADDVIYSWQQALNPRNNVAARLGYDLVTKIDKRDAYTIVVHLRRPYAPFIGLFFSMAPTVLNILPKHALQQYADINRVAYNSHPIGIGPFKVERYEHGSSVSFVANPLYWRGRPKLDRIIVRFIPDENTIATQLRTHEIDMERQADPNFLHTYQQIPGVRVFITPINAFAQVAYNLNDPMLADRPLRQALAYASDRRGIIAKVTHGVDTFADSDQPSFLWAHANGLPQYASDPKRAQALLESAGWHLAADGFRYRNGQRLSLQIASNTGGGTTRDVEQLLQQQWRAVGIDSSIKEYSAPLYFATYGEGGIVQSGKFQVAFFGWINGVDPDDSQEWMCDQVPPNGQNVYHFCNPRLDAAERVALGSFDLNVRKKAYQTIQEILADEQPAMFVWYIDRVSVLNTDLKNFRPAHAVSLMWNPWEWEI